MTTDKGREEVDAAVEQMLRAAGWPVLSKYMPTTRRALRQAMEALRGQFRDAGYREGYEDGRQRGIEIMMRRAAND